jgi:hypothetical protein
MKINLVFNVSFCIIFWAFLIAIEVTGSKFEIISCTFVRIRHMNDEMIKYVWKYLQISEIYKKYVIIPKYIKIC